ncbi:MAG: phage portal protein [Sarcina sp.]
MDFIKTEITGLYGHEVIKEMSEIIKLYDIYDGKGQDWNSDEADYIPTKKRTNYIKNLIKQEARFLFGKTPTFEIVGENEEYAAANEYINKILDANLFNDKLVKGARDCFIGKRVAIKIHADATTKSMRIMFVPSLEFVYEPFEDRVDELKKIIFFHQVNEETAKEAQVIWKQKYEMVEGKCLLTEGFYNGYGTLLEMLCENQDLKLSGIPAYVIINDGLSGDLKGESDVAEIFENAMAYNMLASEDIDTLKKGMNRIIYGLDVDEQSSKLFKLKAGAFWDVETSKLADGKQAQIGTVDTDFNYDTRMENTLNRIKSDMHEVLNIPLINNQDLKGMMTSGKSMKALYWQLITRCEEKWQSWQPALIWMIRAIVEITSVYNIENIGVDVNTINDLNISVINNYPLQEDEDNEMLLDLNKVNSQAMSRKSFIKKWGNVTDDIADEELKQIQLEKQMLEEGYSSMGVDEDD